VQIKNMANGQERMTESTLKFPEAALSWRYKVRGTVLPSTAPQRRISLKRKLHCLNVTLGALSPSPLDVNIGTDR
jgi:hypothetical protein